jgi:RNA polymerase sigma-70 factor, ECF subfamily
VAAQTTIAPAAYSVRVEPCPDHSARKQPAAMASHHPDEQALSPARGSARSLEAVEKANVAIIAEVNWAELSDEALIATYRDTADRAMAEQYANELFRRHHVKVARWCLGFTGDRESAADLAQEICVKAYRNLPNFKGDSKFSTWLYSIARNHSFNAVRSRASMPEMDSDETVVDTLPDLAADSPLATVERKQLTEIARQLVNEELDELEKTVFTLHFAEELPLDAITRMLKLENASGAKAYLVSARRKLERAVRRWKAKA